MRCLTFVVVWVFVDVVRYLFVVVRGLLLFGVGCHLLVVVCGALFSLFDVVCGVLFVVRCFGLVACGVLFVVCCLPMVVRCWLLAVGCWLFVVFCLLFVLSCLFVGHCWLFVVCRCSLLFAVWRLLMVVGWLVGWLVGCLLFVSFLLPVVGCSLIVVLRWLIVVSCLLFL